MDDSPNKARSWLVCLVLGVAILAAYARLGGCGFINYDDTGYVTANEMIQHGLNARSLAWAFTTSHASNWHPVTWISHIVDFQIYGMKPAGHHLTSLLLHLANSILLFLLLRRMTGARWAAALVAALFALHPLHVESVAWVSERKDVLSTFFWMLTVCAYLRYVELSKGADNQQVVPTGKAGTRCRVSGGRGFYALALTFFALGLMSKPMLVTLPFILLLLDFWPLRRVEFGRWLWMEKMPFFLLAAIASVITFLAQHKGGAVASLEHLPLVARLAGVPLAYLRYVGKTVWPARLAVFYPPPDSLNLVTAGVAAIVLALITVWTIRRAGAQPYLAVGWLWFLGALAPVIGFVQVGAQAIADRYAYIPIVGLFIMVVWSAREWRGWRPARPALPCLAGAALGACFLLTQRQAGYWTSTQTIFTHALAVGEGGFMAYCHLGEDCVSKGEFAAALDDFAQASRLDPDNADVLSGSGLVLMAMGRMDEAMDRLLKGARLYPGRPDIHSNLAHLYLWQGRIAEALDQFQQEVDLDPNNSRAQLDFADALLEHGLADNALPHFQKALEIRPDLAEAHYKLGNVFLQKGRTDEAAAHYRQALQIQPDNLPACTHLAWVLATSPRADVRQGAEAVELARRAGQLSGDRDPRILGVLAAAYAEARQFPESVATAQRARQMALSQTNNALVDVLDHQLKLYQSSLPFRDTVNPDNNTHQ